MTFVTRFAPSPTGPLHLGHAYSALTAHDMALSHGGDFLLRIDDLDQTRARPKWEAQIKEDLAWLGLSWPEPCRRESEHRDDYDAALDHLWSLGVLYPCDCTRRDIAEALSAPQEAPRGPDGVVYPGTCRLRVADTERLASQPRTRPTGTHLRLHMAEACALLARSESGPEISDAEPLIAFRETGQSHDDETGEIVISTGKLITDVGDVVVSRRDFGAAYHLAVVVDDAAQNVTHVVRGQDLFAATVIHVVLQRLLDLPTPIYHHHRLIRDETGRRLAKRDDARAIQTYRSEGVSPEEIRAKIGL